MKPDAPGNLTEAQRWLGPEPKDGDDPVPDCVQVPVPDGGVQDEGKDGDKGKGPDKAEDGDSSAMGKERPGQRQRRQR